jgi:hypothetical protein
MKGIERQNTAKAVCGLKKSPPPVWDERDFGRKFLGRTGDGVAA